MPARPSAQAGRRLVAQNNPSPGTLVSHTPAGRTYTTTPTRTQSSAVGGEAGYAVASRR